MDPEFLNHLADLPGLAVQNLTDHVHDLTPRTRNSSQPVKAPFMNSVSR